MDIKEVMKLPYGSKVKIVGRENSVWEVCNTSLLGGNRNIFGRLLRNCYMRL